MISRLVSFARSTDRADICTLRFIVVTIAFNAFGRINHVGLVAFIDCADRTHALASSTLQTFVSNFHCHTSNFSLFSDYMLNYTPLNKKSIKKSFTVIE